MDHPATDGQPPHSAGEQGAASSGRGLRKVSQRSLVIGALGVVFGDIGTSPLYSMRECFLHGHVDAGASANVIGVLSLIIWSLIVIICIKYLIYILRADNKGEGGVLALLTLAVHGMSESSKRRTGLVLLGVFGAALLYGDGMITPAISVLSAVEGLQEATPAVAPFVVPVTICILIAVFSVQYMGTEKVGWIFGPITLCWFVAMSFFGICGLVKNPAVLAAFNPWHGLHFAFSGGWNAFLVLGSVFLVMTGGEALYADMGHFGKRPIRIGWFAIVFPALLLNYLGQGAMIMLDPAMAVNPFFKLVGAIAPAVLLPMVVLATLATVIASQALITGTYSLTLQAIQLGYFPRAAIKHTSEHTRGQIYIGLVNWLLMFACVGLVLKFGTSTKLAAAYGVSVTLTMLITTLLFFFVTRNLWKWSLLKAGGFCTFFLVIQGAFFGANLVKFADGGWFPLVVGLGIFALMTTWKRGRELVGKSLEQTGLDQELFISSIARHPPLRVPGTAIFMTGNRGRTPGSLLHNLKHNRVLHERVIFLTLVVDDEPYVLPSRRVELQRLADGFWRLTGHYGYMQRPDVPRLLRACSQFGLELTAEQSTFFLGRETIIPASRPGMARWRGHLFGFLSKIAQQPAGYFRIPPGRVIELGMQVEV
ncbi:MAG: potassium transporter Kup [Verrucomicrobiales bacterium]|nr:potassium transporter Kup [Verrucomicrobiales bacterium]